MINNTFKYIYIITIFGDKIEYQQILKELNDNTQPIEPTTRGIKIPEPTITAIIEITKTKPSFQIEVQRFNALCGLTSKYQKATTLMKKFNKQTSEIQIKIGTTDKGSKYTIQKISQ